MKLLTHYATIHRGFSATLLTWFCFSPQLLFNMNLFTVGAGQRNDNWTELEWNKHVVGSGAAKGRAKGATATRVRSLAPPHANRMWEICFYLMFHIRYS